jgi:helicase required for RNAi-mediated heterochromatin assembly 1
MNPFRHESIIDGYYRDAMPSDNDEGWLLLPEVPDSQEMKRKLLSDDPRVPENQIEGNWSSKEDHLHAQYAFLREESTFALRRATELVREQPHVSELDHRETSPGIGIYEKVNATTKSRRRLA